MRLCSRRRRGASAVELALLLPILALLFVFAVDFARLYYHYSIVTNCARNGALYASDPTAAAYSPYADYSAAALADASNLSPQYQCGRQGRFQWRRQRGPGNRRTPVD